MMFTIDGLLGELEQEARITRRVLERVPGDRLGWKPHDKSWSLGQLALHVAKLPGTIAKMASASPYALAAFTQPAATDAGELIAALEASLAQARDVLRAMDDSDLSATWTAVEGDRVIMALPTGALLRSFMLNHWYHHRGQLCVYLRQVGALVPAVYGPSADENPLADRSAAA